DVGATIVTGHDLLAVDPIQQEVAARWPGELAVMEKIGERPGLVRQSEPQDRRVSYYCDPEAVTDDLAPLVAELGCDLLYSADRYLDVLPGGVNKGSTLTKLVDELGISKDRVLVAGDTLNDLSMYGIGFPGVAVGEAEPGLLRATEGKPRTFHATEPGTGGILEAIEHFGLLSDEHIHNPDDNPDVGKADLVMVYHRLPYDEVIEDGEVKRRRPKSPNGIIPTLLSFFTERSGSWVAWSTDDPRRGKFATHTVVDPERYPGLVAARLPLTKKDVDIFYKRFSKEAFWPLLHTFWERARFKEEDWQVYCRVNKAFAERAAAEAAYGGIVWIHDYNLWMVPAYLRELRPDVKIAFLHHTHFPSADVFNVVPWRRDIVGSLLQCDYISFHIPRQVENFVDVARGVAPVEVIATEDSAPRFRTYGFALGLDTMPSVIEVGGRQVHLGANPVGVDVNLIERTLTSAPVQKSIARVAEEFEGQRIALAVSRLDYTKGVLQQLQAFERALEEQPDLQGDLSLVLVCVPAAGEMTVYRQLQTQIEQAVGRINGRFSRMGWTPVHFYFRPIPFEELLAYYANADVMWITPLRDGLNLVAKEYAAVHGIQGTSGMLVLSEFAGAAAELRGALLTNPHDLADLVRVFLQAVDTDETEAKDRMRGLWDTVRHHDSKAWADGFLEAIAAATD
ncbi:MAG: glucosylglycerol-phosphate synthase, partial [Nocardioides sp.]|nr:glucosylglycerol-phosphate synthase [Nocardioides sp.]